MNDNTTPELTDQQIALGSAFNAAAKSFLYLLEVQRSKKPSYEGWEIDTANSFIAREALVFVDLIDPEMGPNDDNHAYLNVMKASALDLVHDYFKASSSEELEDLKENIEQNINFDLFAKAVQVEDLPSKILRTGHPEFSVPKLPGM